MARKLLRIVAFIVPPGECAASLAPQPESNLKNRVRDGFSKTVPDTIFRNGSACVQGLWIVWQATPHRALPGASMKKSILAIATLAALPPFLSTPAFALKYAAPEHNLTVDPTIPSWQPGVVESKPEEELNIVGADIMDEIVLGWTKIYRKQDPRLSLTLDRHDSGA